MRSHDLNVVAIHHHMTGVKPIVIFLHYYGTGPAAKLAEGVRAAVELLGGKSIVALPVSPTPQTVPGGATRRSAKAVERGLATVGPERAAAR